MPSSFKRGAVASLMAVTVLSGAAPAALAQSPSITDLQAQIAQLRATIERLSTSNSQPASACNGFTWSRSLGLRASGTDVLRLQQFLNSDPDTRVALSGPGSLGAETSFYGPATAAAVSKFQTKYRSEILAPGGLTAPTGFFGPSSIRKANALCAVAPNPTTPTNPNPDNNSGGVSLSGEGTLDTFEIEEADTTDIEEALGDAVIAELTIEARNGDIEINRLDFALVADSTNAEKDPWDVFENLSLWIDGDKIAEIRTDDRRDFLNRNQGTLRFSNLDIVLEEDEEVTVQVAASIENNISGAGTNATWNISAERLRYFDADGVATDESSFGELGDSVSFDIVQRGDGEALKFALNGNNDSKNIVVDDRRRTNNETIVEYTIEAIDNDIELDTLYVNIETGTALFADVVQDVRLVVDGKTFRKDAIVDTGTYTTNNVRVAFDIDGDITIDEDDTVTARVVVDLKPRTAYQNGETIIARVTSAERDLTEAEGADDVTEFSGSVVGKTHRLISEGIISSGDDVRFSFDTLGQNDTTGVFEIEFEVTAVEGDFYINSSATSSTATTSSGVQYSVETSVGTPSSVSAVLESTAREDANGVFVVREGQTETFTLLVIVDAAAAGQHRVALNTIYFTENPDGVTSLQSYQPLPQNEYRTPFGFINE